MREKLLCLAAFLLPCTMASGSEFRPTQGSPSASSWEIPGDEDKINDEKNDLFKRLVRQSLQKRFQHTAFCYHLLWNEKGWYLEGHTAQLTEHLRGERLPAGRYNFVALRDENGGVDLRVSQVSGHSHLSEFADSVLLAGELTFNEEGNITGLNDQSGTYYSSEEPEIERLRRIEFFHLTAEQHDEVFASFEVPLANSSLGNNSADGALDPGDVETLFSPGESSKTSAKEHVSGEEEPPPVRIRFCGCLPRLF